MAEIAAAGVGFGIPIVGEFYGSRLVAGGGEEDVGVAPLLVRTAADLAQAQHLEERDGVLQRTDADHSVQIFSHWVSSSQRVRDFLRAVLSSSRHPNRFQPRMCTARARFHPVKIR